jgi:hypothetical protein
MSLVPTLIFVMSDTQEHGNLQAKKQKQKKTYNRRDSQMVTHSSTSRPVQCLCMAERTGCPVLTDLWSYVLIGIIMSFMTISDWQARVVTEAEMEV